MISSVTSFFSRILCTAAAIGFIGASVKPSGTLNVIAPLGDHAKAYDQAVIFVLSAPKGGFASLTVSTQWSASALIPISSDADRKGFPKAFLRLIPQGITLESVVYSFQRYGGLTRPDTIRFSYTDTVTIRSFWQKAEFQEIVHVVSAAEASQIVLSVQGWKDSVITSEYEDPNSGDLLYKYNATLLPGLNRVYFAPDGKKQSALEYRTTLLNEASTVAGRDTRFHGSKVEESCAGCHDGMPSNGKAVAGDACITCHKSVMTGQRVHAPVEAKDCGTCHEWSGEKKALIVKDGTPDVCYTCHSEKKTEVDASPTPHAVASDCMACHSAHGSSRPSMVKADVYSLCTSCHERFTENHPVSRHPVRFTKLKNKDNREITCGSCHNPHGATMKGLLRAKSSKYELCADCHTK